MDNGNAAEVGRVLVIIPTYNERANLPPIVERLRSSVPAADLLIVDDASPDGTGEVADGLATRHESVHVLHRGGKEGLGVAYIAGFGWGLARSYDVMVEMDADGSHAPEELPRLLDALGEADLALGSRWVRGGRVRNWPASRRLLSRGANIYARVMLGIPLHDATGGYRAYRATALEKIGLENVESQGYCFQIDLTVRTVRHGLRTVEVPITFVDRTTGDSKMSRAIVVEAFWRVATWGLAYWFGRLAGRRRHPESA